VNHSVEAGALPMIERSRAAPVGGRCLAGNGASASSTSVRSIDSIANRQLVLLHQARLGLGEISLRRGLVEYLQRGTKGSRRRISGIRAIFQKSSVDVTEISQPAVLRRQDLALEAIEAGPPARRDDLLGAHEGTSAHDRMSVCDLQDSCCGACVRLGRHERWCIP